MKKLTAYIATILISSPLFAAKISDSQLELGRESAADNKEILFNIGEGTGNPKIRANYSTKKLEFTNDGTNFAEFGTGGDLGGYNIIDNPGFESDLTNWTNTGSGSLSVDTDAADVYQGQKSALFDAAAASDVLASEAVTIPGGLRGNLCSVEVQYKGGDDNLKLQAYDGTNVLAEVTLEASANFSKAMVTLTCPSSGTLQGRLIASADAAAVNVDNWVVGKSSDILNYAAIAEWQDWTPTYSASGSMTFTSVSTYEARYRVVGNKVEFFIHGEGTTGGTASNSLRFSLPINASNNLSSSGLGPTVFYAQVQDGGTDILSVGKANLAAISGVSNVVLFKDPTSANFGLGTQREFLVAGFYEINPNDAPLNVNPVQRVETSAWHVNARLISSPEFDIIGATTTERIVSSSTGVINNNYGSIDAQIMCNGAAPTGTTCSGVNELPGIAFDAPRAGPAYVCVRGIFYASEQSANTDFSPALTLHRVATDGSVSAGNLGSTWSSLEFINLQQWRFELEAGLVTTNHDVASPYYLCGIANLTAGKNGFVVASQSAYAQGVPTEMEFSAVRWNVFPIEQQLPQALLISPEPAGEVASFAMNTCPTGWLKADGSAVNRTANSRLFDAIGTTFGVGDGSTTFNLPDMRGEFVRGFDDGRGVDSGRVFGSSQDDLIESHGHDFMVHTAGGGYNAFIGSYGPTTGSAGREVRGPGSDNSKSPVRMTDVASGGSGTTQSRMGAETRPRNVALLYCIRK
jgi:microcystin-dependent protein